MRVQCNRASRLAPFAFLLVMFSAGPLHARQTRDSAGITIVENTRPLWSATEALRLAGTPSLVIGTRPEPPYELSRVAGAVQLSDGRIVIADGGSLELRFFDSTGTFIRSVGRRGEAPGEFSAMESLARLPGDTLAVVSRFTSISFFSGQGAFVHRQGLAAIPRDVTLGIPIAAAVLQGRAFVRGVMTQSRTARGARWIDSIPLVLVGSDSVQLGNFPSMLMVPDDIGPRPPWFGPTAEFASDGTTFYVGYGGVYSIRVYSLDGRLQRVIRRQWTPVRVTQRDIDAYVTEWAKRWIRATGPDAERQRQDLRDDPYATEVPAFSQLIADRAGRLWVREAHLADAPRAGNLSTSPLVPSAWSVFDARGRWLGDVAMPAFFQPMDIGQDYVLGVARDADGVETVVRYSLGTAR